MTEQQALLILNAIPGLENRKILKLMEHLGSAQQILNLNVEQLTALGFVSTHLAENIIHFDKDSFLKSEDNLIQKNGVRVLYYTDPEYPQCLREIPDAPVVLYTKGDVSFLGAPSIGVVGSRRASLTGQGIAERLSRELAERGIAIISGLARGIDAAAHRGCLKAGGKTAAILGAGLCHIYPPQNVRLFGEIAETGVLISEYAMNTYPMPYNFPRRNRIISGLSDGILVVEAALKSGALITVDCALEQGKEIFAVPGYIDNPMTEGTNTLIKQGAKVVTSIDDIMEEIQWPNITQSKLVKEEGIAIADKAHPLLESIKDEPIHIDALIEEKKLNRAQVIASLLHLELKEIIMQLPGQFFVRKPNKKKGQHVKI